MLIGLRLFSQRVLMERTLSPATLTLAEGKICTVTPGRHAPSVDVGTRALLPGIVDLHGDALERPWMPRPNVFFPVEIALLETDRQLLSNGITTHDDETPAQRAFYASLGASICEFPVNEETARAARAEGAEIILGGPNVVRGQSHANRMSARTAIANDLATVLTSDYYYPSLFRAVFPLARHRFGGVESLWALVAENPARAAALFDRGVIRPGARADLVAIDDSDPELPEVSAVWVAGRLDYSADARLMERWGMA